MARKPLTVRDLRVKNYVLLRWGNTPSQQGPLVEGQVQWGITKSGGSEYRYVSRGTEHRFVDTTYKVSEVDPKEIISGTGDDREIKDMPRFRIWYRNEDPNSDPMEGFESEDGVQEPVTEIDQDLKVVADGADVKKLMGDLVEVPE
jgi:hypothetical protein